MTSILARTLRSILASYVTGITFSNNKTDYFQETWSDLPSEIKAQYLGIIEQISKELTNFGRKKSS